MTYTQQLTMMKTAVSYTLAALVFGAIGAYYMPAFEVFFYVPAMVIGGLSIPLAAYVDFLHS